jgi:hypothetical protein
MLVGYDDAPPANALDVIPRVLVQGVTRKGEPTGTQYYVHEGELATSPVAKAELDEIIAALAAIRDGKNPPDHHLPLNETRTANVSQVMERTADEGDEAKEAA